ncbi:MAG: hypothetical protein IPN40_16470 [Uliginosibacterium sp.]|nr:hypothetical protein [Uliginosibacterium sp.]
MSTLLANIAVPAYIMGRYWDILGWNAAAAELFTGWLDQPRSENDVAPNMLRFVFLRPENPQLPDRLGDPRTAYYRGNSVPIAAAGWMSPHCSG